MEGKELNVNFFTKFRYVRISNKRDCSFCYEVRHYPHSVCGILSFDSNGEGLEEGVCGLYRVTTVVFYSSIFLLPNRFEQLCFQLCQ